MERFVEQERLAFDRDLAFLHRLQQRRLRLRWRAVDLVGEQQPGEQRAAAEHELVRALVEHERAGEVGGQQVRRELGAGEAQPERLRERPRRERLAQAGEVLEEHVAAREHAAQDQAERRPLADDGGVHLVEHRVGQS